MTYRILLAAVAFACATACSGPPPTQNDLITNNENAALEPLRGEYDATVVGFDVKGNQLDVAIDLQQYSSIDEHLIPELKAGLIKFWRDTWVSQHPHQHAQLSVRLVDKYGSAFLVERAKV